MWRGARPMQWHVSRLSAHCAPFWGIRVSKPKRDRRPRPPAPKEPRKPPNGVPSEVELPDLENVVDGTPDPADDRFRFNLGNGGNWRLPPHHEEEVEW